MKNKKNSFLNVSEKIIFILFGVSMLVLIRPDIGEISLQTFLIFLISLVWVGTGIYFLRKGRLTIKKEFYRMDLLAGVLFIWEFLSVIGKMIQSTGETTVDYSINVAIMSLVILYFLFMQILSFKRNYLDIILYIGLLVMAFMMFCFLCDMEFLWMIAETIENTGQAASFLMLIGMIVIYQYCMCQDKFRSCFYLLTCGVTFLLLFINYNIISLWIMVLIFFMIPVWFRPTAALIKKDMQVMFLYVFMLSNMSLLTNYTSLLIVDLPFELEHSVYLELLFAIGAAVFFYYWDRIPNGADPDRLILRKLRRIYKFLTIATIIIFSGLLFGGSKWNSLGEGAGSSMIKSFAIPLIKDLSQNDNIFIIGIEKIGLTGIVLILVFLIMAIGRIGRNRGFDKPMTGLFSMITIIFMLQLLFWVPAMNVLPIYLYFMVLALFYKEERIKVKSTVFNIERKEVNDNEKI
ncbi:MAG: hypothetical protein HDR17_09970 [Lachnospiraceae bacterium]|nr:hypothetical protein [Lachnospiraceae bacterium]